MAREDAGEIGDVQRSRPKPVVAHGAKNVDLPIAGLLKDLKSRGMLDETLVVWSTEFGRRPGGQLPGMKGRTQAGSRVYFEVPVPAKASNYRVTVLSFDIIQGHI